MGSQPRQQRFDESAVHPAFAVVVPAEQISGSRLAVRHMYINVRPVSGEGTGFRGECMLTPVAGAVDETDSRNNRAAALLAAMSAPGRFRITNYTA